METYNDGGKTALMENTKSSFWFSNKWSIVTIAVLTIGVLLTFTFAGTIPNPFDETAPVARQPSQICGPFDNPTAVAGIPNRLNTSSDSSFIVFADNYTLMVDRIPSMYMGRRALFTLDNGAITQYALIQASNFHPCPTAQNVPGVDNGN